MNRKIQGHEEKDRVSSVPDEIIIDILCLVPLKSAVITDVLSQRWRGLWTQIESSIVELELSTPFPSSLAENNTRVNLPKLKKLSLHVTHPCCKIAAELITSCPALEELFYSVNHTTETEYSCLGLNISSRTLKRLSMVLNYVKIYKIVIDVGELAYLSIKGFRLSATGTCWVQKQLLLHQLYPIPEVDPPANNRTPNNDPPQVMNQKGYQVSGKITVIRSSFTVFYETDNMKTLPMFRNLTRLELTLDLTNDCNGILALIDSCPNLEVLNLEFFSDDLYNQVKAWKPQINDITLNNIKRIQIKVLHGLDDYSNLIELVKYLLRCSKGLELLHLSVVEVDVHTEGQLCEHLHSSPRISSGCTVKFSAVRVFGCDHYPY